MTNIEPSNDTEDATEVVAEDPSADEAVTDEVAAGRRDGRSRRGHRRRARGHRRA
ncbi:MAG: hypothetical protein IPG03_08700 [Candidatus Microthrix sp.]|nr:hypothetical protein [Candidatus Microthrix sp.]MBK6502434.1 hypothetical protein [Candidatus Microthrix sp.]